MYKTVNVLLVLLLLTGRLVSAQQITGELKTWHCVTLTFDGPETSEFDTLNPFLNYRMEVTFSDGSKTLTIPGFYAADGNAGQTGARSGNKWQVRFAPPHPGEWAYQVSFRKGKNIAISDNPSDGGPMAPDGAKGKLAISKSDKAGKDLRAKGRLLHTDSHYLQFAGTGEYFVKGGANSPEDLLGYYEFDQTPAKHRFEPHASEWREGDPTWQKSKGKNLIGALNYLSSTGINAVYFLTMNVMGDGKDVWPWTDEHERYRFDCSKLDQWDLVFAHMGKLGLVKHVVTQETENECLLDIGQTGIQRKLYYRELVARFAHHPGLIWNMGEENGIAPWTPIGQTDKLRKDMISYMHALDPYQNPVVIHTLPELSDHERTMAPLLGDKSELDGVSFQIHHLKDAYQVTADWRKQSAEAGKKWVVWIDEIGPADTGVLPDTYVGQQDTVRRQVIWANLMAGGAGIEHYFGYKYPHNDLNCEDWHSRDRIWRMTSNATDFFQKLPLDAMQPHPDLVSVAKGYCFAQEGGHYVVYLEAGGEATIDLKQFGGSYTVKWYNPRAGGKMLNGKVKTLRGGGKRSLGLPPTDPDEDWVAYIYKK
ncbi:DUF5060 domain-containing protein [Pontibacter sp. E15-1]|uniref:DUF5060 domain-containing protein n=1 Tax=Pontibacter sp. E15-1 TaxID=2919918 RepID=UPI001F4FC725|nr:DUF5060 domain-containing protein [Pontibacter sp. E15-1]MCJ8163298.1 DUF5060 domain-containing protein [Pontibacter sp. E15-1]